MLFELQLVPISDNFPSIIEGGVCLGDALLQVLVQLSREFSVVIPGNVFRSKGVQHASEEFGGDSKVRRMGLCHLEHQVPRGRKVSTCCWYQGPTS